MVKLMFSRSKHPGSYLIRALTWSDYSHVEVLLKDSHIVGSNYPKGVEFFPLDRRVKEASAYLICEVDVDENKVRDFLTLQVGKPYDKTAIFGILMHRDWHEDDSWFCSELVCAALQYAGVDLVKKPQNRITPQDVLQSPLVLRGPF